MQMSCREADLYFASSSLSNDPVNADLRRSLVIKSADWPVVHHATEVRGLARAAEAGVHTLVVAAGLAHLAVRVLTSHHHISTCQPHGSPVYTRPGDMRCMAPPLCPGDRSTGTGHPAHWPQLRGRRDLGHTGQVSPHIAAGNTRSHTDNQGPPGTRGRSLRQRGYHRIASP